MTIHTYKTKSFIPIHWRIRFHLWLHRKVWPLLGRREDPFITQLKQDFNKEMDRQIIFGTDRPLDAADVSWTAAKFTDPLVVLWWEEDWYPERDEDEVWYDEQIAPYEEEE